MFMLSTEEGRRFGKLFEHEVVVTRDYSGIDSYREALTRGMLPVSEEFRLHLRLDCIRFARTCDKDELPQKVLLEMSRQVDHNSSCAFCEINDRLCETALDLLDAMMPTGKTSKKTAAKVFNTMYEWLEDNWNWAYLGKSECLVHGICCPTWPLDTSRLEYSKTGVDQAPTRPLVINTSGMTCTGWSAVSSRQSARRKDLLSLR